MIVSLFVPCLVDQAAADTALAVTRVLKRLGHQVRFDQRQTCCGQALFNSGFKSEARELAVKFLRLFGDAETIVAPSGSCVSMVKHHYGELDLNQSDLNTWGELKDRIWEFCSFLSDSLQVTDIGAYFPHRVGYHASCHLLRDLGIKQQPVELLKKVNGLELIEGQWGDECCGFGGAFSAKYTNLSNEIADRRGRQLLASDPQFITGADDSCLMHLDKSFQRFDSKIKTIHIARILASEKGGSK